MGVDDFDLEQVFEYQSYEGLRFRTPSRKYSPNCLGIPGITAVRSKGTEPAVTDFVFWGRKAAE